MTGHQPSAIADPAKSLTFVYLTASSRGSGGDRQKREGDLARVKHMFELAHICPEVKHGREASKDDECLAKRLLDRPDIPDEPVGPDAGDETGGVKREAAVAGKVEEQDGESESAKSENGDRKRVAP